MKLFRQPPALQACLPGLLFLLVLLPGPGRMAAATAGSELAPGSAPGPSIPDGTRDPSGGRVTKASLALSDADDTGPGSLDPLDAQMAGVGGVVTTTVVQPDGKTILAGRFTSVLGVARTNLARLNADGSLDPGFDPNANDFVLGVAVQADGKILLGGGFTTLRPNGAATPATRNQIARLNADGSLDAGFDPNTDGYVNSVAVLADGKILLGGSFTTFQPNGAATPTTRNRIARLNADGSVDPGFNPNANDGVNSMAVLADGKILLGGRFTALQPDGAASATTRNRIARLNADGSVDPGFNPNANDYVYSVAVQADGKILLGGAFTALKPNGAATPTTRNNIARLNADGSLDPGFNPNANSDIFSVAVQADAKILLGGRFTTLQPNGAATPTTRSNIARLNADGSVDPGFNPSANDYVYGVAVQADGQVLLGGGFTTLQPNGAATPSTRTYFARLNNDAATQLLGVPDSSQVLWQRGGTSPEVSQVTFELSTDSGATWTALGHGTRVGTTADWQLAGLSLPASGQVRARGHTAGGYSNGSAGLVATVAGFTLDAAPTFTHLELQAGGFLLQFTGGNPAYQVEATGALVDPIPGGWTYLGDASTTAPGQFQFLDAGALSQPRRFYRLRWQ